VITKAECYERQVQCNSLYRAMLHSGSPVDAANAETYRLASQEWGEIAAAMPGTERHASASAMLDSREIFDPQRHIDNIQARWDHYLRTGKGHDDMESMTSGHQQQMIKEDRIRRRMATFPFLAPVDARVQALSEWDNGKEQWVKDARKAIASLGPGSDRSPDDRRRFVNQHAINMVLNEFRFVLGLPIPASETPGAV
jgi:hypothetical protein